MRYIIGIDEVGRGALAGSVTVAATAATVNSKFRIQNSELKLKDSKKLSPNQREIWFRYIKNELALPQAVASVSSKIIDKINITNAANLAATRALDKLTKNLKLKTKNYKIFLDGGLYLQKIKTKNYKPKTLIKGDEKIPAIMLASIVAKVTRDRMMVKLHKKYPEYNFDRHKGYGTKKHIKAIIKYGPSKVHRLAFLKKIH